MPAVADLVGIAAVLLVGAAGTAVVLTREPGRQAIVLSSYGLLLGILMLAFQAPDVAMSQLFVGAAVIPLLVVLAISKVNKERDAHRAGRAGEDDE